MGQIADAIELLASGQYKTESELQEEIADLKRIGKEGKMTLPMAQRLNRARAELEAIRNAQDTSRRPWPILNVVA
jgi:hypothetical protein